MRGATSAKWVAGAVVVAMAATACSTSKDSDSAGKSGGNITVVLGEPQHGLVGQNTAESEGAEVLNALFTGLVEYDNKTNEPKLAVAEAIDTTDSKTWTIKLKDGYTFHNGEKVDAQSFVRAWNWGANQDNAAEGLPFFDKIEGSEELAPGKDKKPTATELKGLKVVDEKTFTVTLKAPFSQFKTMLGYNAFYPLPKAFEADPKKFGEAPIGNGAFQMDGAWDHNKQIKVKRYDKYPAEGRAKLEGVTFKIYDNLDTAYNDLRADNIQIVDKLPVSALATVSQEFGDRYIYKPESGVGYLGLPLATNPEAFGKIEIRKAISMAIDRDAITKTIFNGTRKPADDFINPIIPGYRKGALGEVGTYNPTKAKELWTQAGGVPGNKIELGYNADGGHKEWIEAVANQLKANLGVDVTAKPYAKFGDMLDDLQAKKYKGAFRMAWSMDYPAAENYLRPIFSKVAIETGSNYGGYVNEEFETTMAEADKATDPAEGLKLYQKADDIVIKDLPYIPVFTYMSSSAYSKSVKNVEIDAQGRMDLAKVELN
ncbi:MULTISPECIES: peptide ABC transporter substrate-binding protein [Streptomyces]|uniref:peptide ABC transporter substrate-binding protein n=1 Tax=Streptomyces TaxID=1883 RepID=UPI000F554AC6|nr:MULTISPECIES: ABC transporter substrate-binding protein [Streptomyces]RPK46229.1 Oligopeptide-binding protein OppA precursor [Streptomyces sp. ADI91-18]WBY21896.1 ABC transporter substrate-binding protein [Streptomyces goshikiensis]WSS00681.1 ABC transporter substrate-binding protein [Streptomyces goshikiensis]WSX98278.1 ABC transporter substrate-binding protein [Streptomyces goshikiensis]